MTMITVEKVVVVVLNCDDDDYDRKLVVLNCDGDDYGSCSKLR